MKSRSGINQVEPTTLPLILDLREQTALAGRGIESRRSGAKHQYLFWPPPIPTRFRARLNSGAGVVRSRIGVAATGCGESPSELSPTWAPAASPRSHTRRGRARPPPAESRGGAAATVSTCSSGATIRWAASSAARLAPAARARDRDRLTTMLAATERPGGPCGGAYFGFPEWSQLALRALAGDSVDAPAPPCRGGLTLRVVAAWRRPGPAGRRRFGRHSRWLEARSAPGSGRRVSRRRRRGLRRRRRSKSRAPPPLVAVYLATGCHRTGDSATPARSRQPRRRRRQARRGCVTCGSSDTSSACEGRGRRRSG
jgi:hypothetical protein